MRVKNYIENEDLLEFTITVRLTPAEWKKFDVRSFDVIQLQSEAKGLLSPATIQNIIYNHFGLSDSLIGKMSNANEMGRIKYLVDIRRYCFYFLRMYTNLTFAQIGELYGQDHANVMYHSKRITDWIECDTSVAIKTEEIRRVLIDRINPKSE